jgi:type I restriction enzyme S subunit
MSTTAVELGTVLDFFNGKAPPNDEDGDFVVYGSNGTIGKAKSTNHENAIILGRVGAYCGSVEFCDEKFWASDNTIVVKTKDGFDLKYMYYRLKSFPLRSYAGGAAQPLLTHTILRGVRLPVVKDKNRQAKIASILSSYDDQIENNRRRIQLLEQAARLLYKEWFVHLRFPGHEHVKIIDGVPEGWEKKPLSEIADITMGQSPKSIYYNQDGNGLPFHQGVTNFGVRFPSHETYCTVQSRIGGPGDILFSVRAPVGRINITPDKIVIGRGLAAIRSSCDQQNYLFYALKSHFFKEDMIGGGAIFAAITKKDLYSVELMQPTDRITAMFMEHVLPIDLQIANLQQTIERLAKARDLLLPKLMTREVEA